MALSFENLLTAEERTRLRGQVRALSQVSPTLQLSYFLLDWLVIVGTIVLAQTFFSPLTYVLSVILIATRQHALGVMAHEAVHSRIFHSQRKNILVSNLLCAYPMLFQIEMYRHNHLLHHQHTNSEKDPDLKIQAKHPDWQFPMSRAKLARIFAFDFLGKGIYENFKRIKRYTTDPEFKETLAPLLAESKWIKIGFYLSLAAVLTAFGGWKIFAMYWVVPLLWVFPAILRLRNIGEHYGLSWENDLQGTRDVNCSWIEGWLLSPHYIRIHLVHHLYPSVPFYNLPKLRKILLEYPAFRADCRENSSYVLPTKTSVIRDLTVKAS